MRCTYSYSDMHTCERIVCVCDRGARVSVGMCMCSHVPQWGATADTRI